MTVPLDFYLEQAAKCAKSAEECMLPNQREIFLRSASAWQAMADRKRSVLEGQAERSAGFMFPNQGPAQ